jgi:hypothetical protein
MDLMEDLDDDAEVFIVEYGYRSSNMTTVAGGAVWSDDRETDDYGVAKNQIGAALYLVNGHTGGNRYPPTGLRDELEGVG